MERVVQVNFFGTLYATYFALPHVKRSRGSLVAISSLTGKRGIPSYAVYGASKFAVQGLYDSLRLELARRRPRGRGVSRVRRYSTSRTSARARRTAFGAAARPALPHLASGKMRGPRRASHSEAAKAGSVARISPGPYSCSIKPLADWWGMSFFLGRSLRKLKNGPIKSATSVRAGTGVRTPRPGTECAGGATFR